MKTTKAPLAAMLYRAAYIATRASVLAHSRVAKPNFFRAGASFTPATLWYFSQLARGNNVARLRTYGSLLAAAHCANNT